MNFLFEIIGFLLVVGIAIVIFCEDIREWDTRLFLKKVCKNYSKRKN